MIGAGIFASGNLRSSDFRAYEYLINWQADIGRERNRQQMRHPRAANTGHMAGAGSMFDTTDGIAPRCRIEITSDDQWAFQLLQFRFDVAELIRLPARPWP